MSALTFLPPPLLPAMNVEAKREVSPRLRRIRMCLQDGPKDLGRQESVMAREIILHLMVFRGIYCVSLVYCVSPSVVSSSIPSASLPLYFSLSLVFYLHFFNLLFSSFLSLFLFLSCFYIHFLILLFSFFFSLNIILILFFFFHLSFPLLLMSSFSHSPSLFPFPSPFSYFSR